MSTAPTVPSRQVRRRFAIAVVAREVLRETAQVLGRAGIPVMPLKGVVLQRLLYSDPALRPMSDVDVIVPEALFTSAIRALSAAGFAPHGAGRNLLEVSFRTPQGFPLDLHQRLFGRGRYRLSTHDLFARSTLDRELFGFPVWLADPMDTFAHLVGKFACDHVRDDAKRALEELAAFAVRQALEPVALGQHLERCGMARAARFTLGHAERVAPHPVLSAVLHSLSSDPIGVACALLAETALTTLPRRSLGVVPTLHGLNASLARAATSFALNVVDSARYWLLESARGRTGKHLAPFFQSTAAPSRSPLRARPPALATRSSRSPRRTARAGVTH